MRRRWAALEQLKKIGSPGLVERRYFVDSIKTWAFGARKDYFDILEPAWPVGDLSWGDDAVRLSSGITPSGQIVPMDGPYDGEQPLKMAAIPGRSRSGTKLSGAQLLKSSAEDQEAVAQVLEALTRRYI